MNGAADIFESHRSRLFGVAYRMLGTRADAEDVLQDAYLRWHDASENDIRSPIGFLITVTTRLCLDRLRHLKKEREQGTEPWLLERIVEDYVPSPEEQHEIAGEVSVAFLAVLERLGPEERAAFLLREVFDYDYPEIAQLIGKCEATCRQLVHRALPRVREARPRFVVAAESRDRVLKKFLAAIGTGDRQAVLALLAEEVVCASDIPPKRGSTAVNGRQPLPDAQYRDSKSDKHHRDVRNLPPDSTSGHVTAPYGIRYGSLTDRSLLACHELHSNCMASKY